MRLIHPIRLFVCLMALCLSLSVRGQENKPSVIELDSHNEKYQIGRYVDFLEDKEGNISLQQLLQGDYDARFSRSSNDNIDLGFSGSYYWLRFQIVNRSFKNKSYIVEVTNPWVDEIELYYQEDGVWKFKRGGDLLPFYQREISNRYIGFVVDMPTYLPMTIYARVKSSGYLQVPMTIWIPQAHENENHNSQFIFGCIYGFILLMIIDNLYLFFTMRLITYLFYVISMVFTLLFISMLNGHAYEYIWPGFPWIQNHILPFITVSLGFWSLLYCYTFLEIKKNAPRPLHYAILGMIFLSGGLQVLSLVIPMKYAVYLTAWATTADFVLIALAAVVSWTNGNNAGKYFVMAFSLYLFGMVVYGLKTFAVLPLNFFTTYSVHFAAAAQVTLLSMAMGSRLKEFRTEKEAAQREALRLQKEANEELERKVQQRTEEIQESYKTIRLLSEIGQEITASLDIEGIFTVLYKYVNQVMDATIFGVDLYHADKQQIEYRLNIERGERLPSAFVPMTNENNLSVWCVKNRKEIFMSNVDKEYQAYVKKISLIAGEVPYSTIYIPMLLGGEKVLGVVTVQSYERNAYTEQHREIMRTLANYTAIALDNALAYTKVEATNTNILKSIRYAKRIQEAVLTKVHEVKQHFKDGFVFYRPRDIVSGDFYWFSEKEDKIILAAVDCTGHGVPGAFMTMMSNDLLNQIVIENNITSPKKILKILDFKLKSSFHTEGTDIKINDGMDIAICTVYQKRGKVHFAGAKSPLYYFKKNQLLEVKGSKFPIGGDHYKEEKVFDEHVIDYEPGDRFYIFSDGYHDQFGGPEGQKFLSKRFRELLVNLQSRPITEHEKALEEAHQNWKGARHQTDDILVIGIEF